MKLPKEIPAQKEPTLIFVADGARAKWYVASDRDLTRVGNFEKIKPEYTDKPGEFGVVPGGSIRAAASKEEALQMHEEHVFAKMVAEHLSNACLTLKAQRIIIAAPPQLKHQIEAHLAGAVKQRIVHWHEINLYRFSTIKIAERLLGRTS